MLKLTFCLVLQIYQELDILAFNYLGWFEFEFVDLGNDVFGGVVRHVFQVLDRYFQKSQISLNLEVQLRVIRRTILFSFVCRFLLHNTFKATFES